MRLVVLVAVAALVGCGGAQRNTMFVPRHAGPAPARLVDVAVVAYEGDVDALDSADAVELGTLDTESVASDANLEDLSRQAAKIGAERGGTHVVLVGASAALEQRTTVKKDYGAIFKNGTLDTGCESGRLRDCLQPRRAESSTGVVDVTHVRAHFLVARVDPGRWGDLAAPLRPSKTTPATGGYVETSPGVCFETKSPNCTDPAMHASYCKIPCPS